MNFLLIIVLTFVGQTAMMRVNMGSYETFDACTLDIPAKESILSKAIQMQNRMSEQTRTSLCLEEDDGKTEIPK